MMARSTLQIEPPIGTRTKYAVGPFETLACTFDVGRVRFLLVRSIVARLYSMRYAGVLCVPKTMKSRYETGATKLNSPASPIRVATISNRFRFTTTKPPRGDVEQGKYAMPQISNPLLKLPYPIGTAIFASRAIVE